MRISRLPPGIGYSNDKLMQWRLMSYDDTQRYRIGPNFALLPVNRPRCPLRNNRQDGCAVLKFCPQKQLRVQFLTVACKCKIHACTPCCCCP